MLNTSSAGIIALANLDPIKINQAPNIMAGNVGKLRMFLGTSIHLDIPMKQIGVIISIQKR